MAQTVHRVRTIGVASAVLCAVLMTGSAPASGALRLRVDWEGQGGGPTIFARTAPSGPKVADYNSGGDCGLPSGSPCAIFVAGARWEEANVEGQYRAKTISLIVDASWTPFAYTLYNATFLTTPASIAGRAAIYQADGTTIEQSFSLAPGQQLQLSDNVPPRPRKLDWDVERLRPPLNKRTLTVGPSRSLRVPGAQFSCGTQDDRACVVHGFAAVERPDPICLRRRCRYRFVVRSPKVARFRFVIPAGQTLSPLPLRLSRSGLRYVKSHRRVKIFIRLLYARLGEEKPACEINQVRCREHRTSLLVKARYRR